jgi:FkbM family methyltransferase
LPLKTVETDGLKFLYLRTDAPPHDPRQFAPGIEFHQMIESLTGQAAIDVGANIGSYTLPLASRFKEVTAFEPSEAQNRVLRLNVKLNNMRNVRVYQVALSDVTGTMPLYIRRGGAASLRADHYGLPYDNVTLVKTVRLDEFLPKFRELNFMKVDAEGLELRILSGGARMISSLKPTIAVEVHRATIHSNGSCGCDVCNHLRGLGYEVRVTGESSSVGRVHWVWASPRIDA